MSIDEQEKVNDENKEKGLTNAGRSKEESVSGIRCAVCKREFHQCHHITNIFHVWAIHHLKMISRKDLQKTGLSVAMIIVALSLLAFLNLHELNAQNSMDLNI